MVTLDRTTDLSDAEHEEVRLLRLAVYPPEEHANWHGRDVEWDTPEWCVRVRGEDGSLASYIGVYLRNAELDGRAVHVGGVGNVKTHPQARRRGLATLGIRRAIEFFHTTPNVDFALLVCDPGLLEYYGRLGWREFQGRLIIRQRRAACEFTLGRVMTLAVQSPAPEAGIIDLCGPPW